MLGERESEREWASSKLRVRGRPLPTYLWHSYVSAHLMPGSCRPVLAKLGGWVLSGHWQGTGARGRRYLLEVPQELQDRLRAGPGVAPVITSGHLIKLLCSDWLGWLERISLNKQLLSAAHSGLGAELYRLLPSAGRSRACFDLSTLRCCTTLELTDETTDLLLSNF